MIFLDGQTDSSDDDIIITELNNEEEEARRLKVNREREVDVHWSPSQLIKHASPDVEEKDEGNISRDVRSLVR